MGKRVGIKSGCWTILHAGHIWCFEQCRRQCDYLIILTNTDDFIRKKKGSIPIPLKDRLYILEHIDFIDEVHSFEGDTENAWIERFYNSEFHYRFGQNANLIIFHSDELKEQNNFPGEKYADEIIFIPKIDREESVTKIYQEIKNA